MAQQPQQWYRASRCNYLYMCAIAADGTFEVGPEGWTLDKTGIGTYVITHNLGHLRYLPLPGAAAGFDYKTSATIVDRSENSITIGMYTSQQLTDCGFGLLVVTTQ